jgi:GNAT superfamily N-acetyltransferase
MPHPKVRDVQRISRLVVRPDYQGLGLGAYGFAEALAKICKACGFRMSIGTSHPGLIRPWARSPLWRMTKGPDFGTKQGRTTTLTGMMKTTTRRVAHFMYAGPGFAGEADRKRAIALWNAAS